MPGARCRRGVSATCMCMHVCVWICCRTHKAFETWLKKGAKGTEYILPTETLVMMNVVVDFKNQVVRCCLLDSVFYSAEAELYACMSVILFVSRITEKIISRFH